MNEKTSFTFLFIFSILGVLAGIFLHIKWLDYLCKPLIMISIGGYFLLNSKSLDNNVVRFALFAFLFSLFGDSFLMFANRGMIYFVLGLASFLIAQIFYILLFRKTITLSGKKPLLIALDKFLTPIPIDRFLVMSTYIAAQFLIMKGILKQFNL